MAFNKARGSQIKLNSITDEHIQVGTLIHQDKLGIDWETKGAEILATRLLVDYVQVDGKSVNSGTSSVTVTGQISAVPANDDETKGAVIQSGKNKVVLRDSITGDPFVSVDGTEVYGKLTHNGTDYSINFFAKDLAGAEQAHTFVESAVIDFQFPQRFDFNTIAENFASNEKFVDGASDVSARLDLEQIVKDAFGGSYSLDQDGNANRSKTILQEIIDETSGVVNTSVKANIVIDEVVDARGVAASLSGRFATIETNIGTNADDIATVTTEVTNARGTSATLVDELSRIETKVDDEVTNRVNDVQSVRDALASVATGEGASLVSIEDAGAVFTATHVEGALSELETRLATVEETGGEEVKAARDSVITGAHASLDERLEAGETRFEAVKDEVEAARLSDAKGVDDGLGGITPKTFTSVDARMEELEVDVASEVTRATDAEGVLQGNIDTVDGKVDAAQAEIDEAKLSTSKSADGGTTPKTFASVDARLEEAEADHAGLVSQVDTQDAANETRFTDIEAKDVEQDGRLTDLESTEHVHYAEDKKVLAGDALIGTSEYALTTGTFVPGNKSLSVHINGFLQMKGVHYNEQTDVNGNGVGIGFAPELIAEGDVIQLRWYK